MRSRYAGIHFGCTMAQNMTVDVHVHAADKTARDAAAVRLVQAEGRCINVSSLTLSPVVACGILVTVSS